MHIQDTIEFDDQNPIRAQEDNMFYPSGNGPYCVAFDGASVWVTNSRDNTVSKSNRFGFTKSVG